MKLKSSNSPIKIDNHLAVSGANMTGFGIGVSANPSSLTSYPGLVNSNSGNIYPQTSASTVLQTSGSTDLVFEDRGSTSDPYGGGVWVFPSTTNLVANPFDFRTSAGWTQQGTMTETFSGITAPDGIANAQKIFQTTINYADIHVAITSTTNPIGFSIWYQDDVTNPPSRPTYPAFTRGIFATAGPTGVLTTVTSSWIRFFGTFAGGTSTVVGITPAGANAVGQIVNTGPAAAIVVWGFQALNGLNALCLISGTASVSKTIATQQSALLIDKHGNLDFEITFQMSNTYGNLPSSKTYLWSALTTDGLISLSFTAGPGVAPIFILTVRGVDVITTSTSTAISRALPPANIPTEPMTIRVWYNITSGFGGMRVSVIGMFLSDSLVATTGTALAGTSTIYLGTNLGSATAAFTGRFKPYRRPKASSVSPPTIPVEGIIIGDEIVSPFLNAAGSLDGDGSYIYTGGTSGEWVSRPGIGNIAEGNDKITDQFNKWISSINKWKGMSSIRWFCIQVGVFDILNSESSATCATNMQTLITRLKSDNPSAKIILNTMLPAKSFASMSGAMYTQWQTFNAVIRGGVTLTGVDYINDVASVSSPFNDGSDNLSAIYDSGDHLVVNIAGRFQQAQNTTYGFRPILTSLGLLP